MRAGVNALIAVCAAAALHLAPLRSAADEGDRATQEGESRWVPSLAITSGVLVQDQQGEQTSLLFAEGASGPVPLRATDSREQRVVNPFVGGALELMTPALPIPTRPRFFIAGEWLPTFGSTRQLGQDGDPSRIRGPEVDALLASEETNTQYRTDPVFGPRPSRQGFGENDANGQGMEVLATVQNLVFGAKFGMAFPAEIADRPVRIKPSFGWIHYQIEIEGLMVDPSCDPPPAGNFSGRCTNTYDSVGGPVIESGFLRESIITGKSDRQFDGIGPGIDLEMDTGRYGPIGSSLFIGAHGYYILGERRIRFTGARSFDDQIGQDTHVATFDTRVRPWLVRAGIGIRLQWLGFAR